MMSDVSPRKYAWLSIAAAVITISLKTLAYNLTGSVGLLSDAMESVVNLVAAIVALIALTFAERPPDEDHAYGHTKAEYFSSSVESMLILLAAISIAIAAIPRLFNPQPLEQVGLGIAVSILASVVNGGVAVILMRASHSLRSITLKADAHHLLTDVWTTAGVIIGVLVSTWTGWLILDPIIALVVATNIAFIAIRLLRESGHGLLDTALPSEDQSVIQHVFDVYREDGIQFHALRTRMSGRRRFMSVHVLVPGAWSVQCGHDLCERLEHDIRDRMPLTTVFTHLEPIEDPLSNADQTLDRENNSRPAS